MNIYLAKLKEKPVPNVQYKNGASLFLGQHKKEVDEIEVEARGAQQGQLLAVLTAVFDPCSNPLQLLGIIGDEACKDQYAQHGNAKVEGR